MSQTIEAEVQCCDVCKRKNCRFRCDDERKKDCKELSKKPDARECWLICPIEGKLGCGLGRF
jgi:hypothetical protein